MRRTIARVLATLLLVGGLAARVAGGDGSAPPARWVTDASGFISEGARQELDGQLEAYERQTGHQLLVWIDRTTGGIPLEDFTVRAFAAWKVGRKGLDDGLVLFVFSQDQKVRIEVGYGLEGQVPDAIASRIIRQTIVPRIQADDHDGAIRDGVAALRAAIEGQAPPTESVPGPAPSAGAAPSLSFGQMILLGLAVVGFLVLFATNPALATYLLFSLLSGGRGGRGGGGYSGRGYSGGGGRGGGGGASGSW